MHLITSLLLLSPALQDWSAHPLPSVCHPPAHAQGPQLLATGSHLDLLPDPWVASNPPEAYIAPSLLTQLISGELGRSGLSLVPGSSPLLIRGSDTDRERVKAIFSGLNEAGRALEIRLRVLLLPSLPEDLPADLGISDDSAGPSVGTVWSGKTRSGDTIAFGVREDVSFVGGFSIEVATEAGIADPDRSSALPGETLHLTCSRVRGGTAVHVEGLLDIAKILDVGTFDPDTPDLGTVEQPRISVCQVAFSGLATESDPVRVVIRGAADPIGDRTLIISATTLPDPGPASIGWNVRDLAFLSSPGHPLTPPQPGLRPMSESKALLPPSHSPTAPASLVGLLYERSSLGTETGRIHATERLLLVPAADVAGLARTEALIRAIETPLLSEVQCVVRHRDTRIEFPSTMGRQARVLIGEEQPWLTDYRSEIAANSWMPSPVTETAFDGACVEGRTTAGTLHARWWLASTERVRVATSQMAHLGALQQPVRAFSAGSESLERGSRRVLAGLQERLEISLE